VNEVIDNIRLHAEATAPGTVCAQFYPKRHRLDVAIVDQGRGIKRALEESYTLTDYREAISTALMRGVTRNPEVGQGNGLAGTHDIVELNGGELQIWTGDQSIALSTRDQKPIPSYLLAPGLVFSSDSIPQGRHAWRTLSLRVLTGRSSTKN
jgi:hypothetical protein